MSVDTFGEPDFDVTGGTIVRRLQLRAVREVLKAMLISLPAVLAAKESVDLHPDGGADIDDLDRLFLYTTRDWQLLQLLLADIPRRSWPDEVTAVEDAVDAVNETLSRPLDLDL